MDSQHFMTSLNTNAAEETTSCDVAQGFDYTYVIDNTITEKNSDRRKYFIGLYKNLDF